MFATSNTKQTTPQMKHLSYLRFLPAIHFMPSNKVPSKRGKMLATAHQIIHVYSNESIRISQEIDTMDD